VPFLLWWDRIGEPTEDCKSQKEKPLCQAKRQRQEKTINNLLLSPGGKNGPNCLHQTKKHRSRGAFLFIQAADLVWHQRVHALYGIATKSRMARAKRVSKLIPCGLMPYMALP